MKIATLLFLSIYLLCLHAPHFVGPYDILPCGTLHPWLGKYHRSVLGSSQYADAS